MCALAHALSRIQCVRAATCAGYFTGSPTALDATIPAGKAGAHGVAGAPLQLVPTQLCMHSPAVRAMCSAALPLDPFPLAALCLAALR